MPDLICDTNVFYNIASGRIDIGALKAAGHRLLVTPVSILELVSHVDDETFADRKGAATAVLDAADEVLPDPEQWLGEVWGIPQEPAGVDWLDGVRALAGANSVEHLREGVIDRDAGVIRRLDVPVARAWRGGHYDDFADLMIDAVEYLVPGYAQARAERQFRRASRQERQDARGVFDDAEAVELVLLATRARAGLGAVGPVANAPTDEELRRAQRLLRPYAEVYRRYHLGVTTTAFAPAPNDFGDLECFIYLFGDRVVATSERRWLQLAAEAGMEGSVLDPVVG